MTDTNSNDVSPPAKKRRKIEFRNGPSDHCSRCMSMFSPAGLAALNSQEGFRHYAKSECEKSAQDGCAICMMICQNATSSWRQRHGNIFFTSRSVPKVSEAGNRDNTAPVRIEGLSGWSAAKDKYVVGLRIYTTDGKKLSSLPKARQCETIAAVNFSIR